MSINANDQNSIKHQEPVPGSRAARLRGVALMQSDDPLLEYLSPPHRQILRAEGSYEEIAAALGIPVGTVRSRLSRARQALVELRANLSPGGDQAPADTPFPFS
jgi:RNA polymerase sigma-70 factor (ECF subfamily)